MGMLRIYRKDDPGYDTHREITRWMRAAERDLEG